MFGAILIIAGLVACGNGLGANDCAATPEDVESVGKVVFIYGKGLSEEAQTGLAFTISNRVNSPNFPNTTEEVLNQMVTTRRGRTKLIFGRLARKRPLGNWTDAKTSNSAEYQTAIRLSRAALCGETNDPTDGATYFARLPSSEHVPGNHTEHGVRIGDLLFVKENPNMQGKWHKGGPGRKPGGGWLRKLRPKFGKKPGGFRKKPGKWPFKGKGGNRPFGKRPKAKRPQ